jgi:hypothetical protein
MRLNLPPRFRVQCFFIPPSGLFDHRQNKKEPGFFNPGS